MYVSSALKTKFLQVNNTINYFQEFSTNWKKHCMQVHDEIIECRKSVDMTKGRILSTINGCLNAEETAKNVVGQIEEFIEEKLYSRGKLLVVESKTTFENENDEIHQLKDAFPEQASGER